MRISVNWLQELVKLTLSPEKLADLLTIAGLEVEEIEDRRQWAKGVVVGKILQREQHPNADKLSVCQVDVGQAEPLNIVCGASNAKANILVPVATIEAYLSQIDLKIKPTKLRGVRSEGMICSLTELGLEKTSEGIHIFEDDNLTLGSDVRPLFGLDDVILDISPTANRADALSMVGVAREVAALTGGELNLPDVPELDLPQAQLTVKINETQACPAYIGTVIEDVKIAPSPLWLKQKLQAAGVRPINNIVDITNYVLLEWGQPLHAFDREKLQTLAGGKHLTLGVRFAQDTEKIITLDDQERSLSPQNLLITANDKPVAIAGVMGGSNTEVDSETQNIILESALFDGVVIRRSSKAQNLRSESSTRYERGVNFQGLETARNRAISLIQEIAGGQVIGQALADYRPNLFPISIELRLERVQTILGPVKTDEGIGQITATDVERILTDLNCQLTTISSNPQLWNVIVPAYRDRDIEREIDLIEEVARLYGYDHFCDQLPDKTAAGGLSLEYQLERQLRETLRAIRLSEVVHYSLVKPQGNEVVLANPLFVEYSALRTNLLDGLLEALAYNHSQGNGTLNAFEIGRIFWKDSTGSSQGISTSFSQGLSTSFSQGDSTGSFQGGDGIKEADSLAGVLGGEFFPEGRWTEGGKPALMTWYEGKGLLESIFSRLGLTVEYQPAHKDKRFHPGRTASLWLNGNHLGIFGQLHPQFRKEKSLPDAVYAFEFKIAVLFDALKQERLQTPHFAVYSTYPAVERDLAFYAPVQLSVAELVQAMNQAGGNLLEDIQLFDDYRGDSVPTAQRSLAFSLAYRAGDRTLTDAEVDPVHNQIREALSSQFAVTLRS